MNRWYVINTKANNEIFAMNKLRSQNYKVFCPSYVSIIKHARQFKKIIKPFFPGYLFIYLDIQEQSWMDINHMVGVKRILNDGSLPLAINDSIVEDLKNMQNDEGIIDDPILNKCKVGQKVMINDGVFRGLKGIFKGLTAGQRVEVLLNMLGRNLTVKFNTLQISTI